MTLRTRVFDIRNNKFGFTLAEVLITLGIIGVVAALTLPTLIQKHKEQVTVAKAKKIYSTVSQAYLMAIKENGPADEWYMEPMRNKATTLRFASYIVPHLKVVRDCKTEPGCIGYKNGIHLLNGTYRNINYDTDFIYYKVILADGSCIWIRRTDNNLYCAETDGGHDNVCGVVFFDVNGAKEPNVVGKDIFIMYLKSNTTVPSINNDCNRYGNGWGCLNKILLEGKMNYLH